MATKLRSPNKAVDPERSAAMKGNNNAKGGSGNSAGKYGARSAAVGALVPFGIAAGGALLAGTGGNKRALSRHSKTSTGISAISGAAAGGIYGSALGNAAGGALAGAAIGGAVGYAQAKVGQFVGKKLRR